MHDVAQPDGQHQADEGREEGGIAFAAAAQKGEHVGSAERAGTGGGSGKPWQGCGGAGCRAACFLQAL